MDPAIHAVICLLYCFHDDRRFINRQVDENLVVNTSEERTVIENPVVTLERRGRMIQY